MQPEWKLVQKSSRPEWKLVGAKVFSAVWEPRRPRGRVVFWGDVVEETDSFAFSIRIRAHCSL